MVYFIFFTQKYCYRYSAKRIIHNTCASGLRGVQWKCASGKMRWHRFYDNESKINLTIETE
ncbi:MAG: hypothetical protein H6Q59_2685 [Firmicutes bacterium]|nr:hypothetical protein [Bacillota bacterium]